MFARETRSGRRISPWLTTTPGCVPPIHRQRLLSASRPVPLASSLDSLGFDSRSQHKSFLFRTYETCTSNYSRMNTYKK